MSLEGILKLNVARGSAEARAAIAKRRTWSADDGDAPVSVRERNRELFGEPLSPAEAVRRILTDVRTQGDTAVRRYAELLEGHEPQSLEVPKSEWEKAFHSIKPELASALKLAAQRIHDFQRRALPH